MAAYMRVRNVRVPYSLLANYGICCRATSNTQRIQTGQTWMLHRHFMRGNVNSVSRTNQFCSNKVAGNIHRTYPFTRQQYPMFNMVNIVQSFAVINSVHTLCKSGESFKYSTLFCQILTRCRHSHPRHSARSFQQNNKTVMIYIASIAILICGLSYAAVPLYSMFCQVTGLGGQATLGHDIDKVETMAKVADRIITVKFNADTASSMRWNFKPQMTEVKVAPGETALAFYKAKNPTDKPIIGIATYNVIPFEAGQYFNKIQCFCFEEQILNPHEEVDMPVFFYIDPDFAEDPKMENLDSMTLSYTFFEAKEGLELPQPFTSQHIR